MNTSDIGKQSPKRPLRGATVQYKDGRTIKPTPLDVDQILADLEASDDEERRAFLCTLAHNLTIEIRLLLFDRPVSESDLDRAYQINESLHQLTSCVHPQHRRSAAGDVQLVHDIIDSSYLYRLESAIGRALSGTAGSTKPAAREPQMHSPLRSGSGDDLPSGDDIQRELLLFIFRSGGDKFNRKPAEIYSPLADIFGLTKEQRSRLRADKEERLWNNSVEWARQKLVEKELLFKEPRGVWRLTESGRRKAERLNGVSDARI
jgi:hypothetical protein